jgi:hypothetical protein
MASAWDELLVKMLEGAPPYDEPLPLANRKGTLLGVTIPFLVCYTNVPLLWFSKTDGTSRLFPGWLSSFVSGSA